MAEHAILTRGSTLKHLLRGGGATIFSLLIVFASDTINLIFVGALREHILLAAIGLANPFLILTNSLAYALASASPGITSRRAGTKNTAAAANSVWALIITTVLLGLPYSLVLISLLPPLLHLIGATGKTFHLAYPFLVLSTGGSVVGALAIILSVQLNNFGHARSRMYVTLVLVSFNVLFDYLALFILHLDLIGVAISSWLARSIAAGVAFFLLLRCIPNPGLRLTIRRYLPFLKEALKLTFPLLLVEFSVSLTLYVSTALLARYGEGVLAGWSVVFRIWPIILSIPMGLASFAASIFAQNMGAKIYPRMVRVVVQSLILSVAAAAILTAIFLPAEGALVHAFHLPKGAENIIRFFIYVQVPSLCIVSTLFTNDTILTAMGHSTILGLALLLCTTIFLITTPILQYFFGIYGVLWGNVIPNFVETFLLTPILWILLMRWKRTHVQN